MKEVSTMSDDKNNKNQNENKNPDKKENESSYGIALGMCLGVALGVSFGQLLFHNMALGMCTGLGIGLCLGSAYDAVNDRKKADGNPAEQSPKNKQDSEAEPEEKKSERGEE